MRYAVGKLLWIGSATGGAQLHETQDHAIDGADQTKHRPQRSNGRQVGDEVLLGRLDAFHGMVGDLAGILDAVLQSPHAGRQNFAQKGRLRTRQIESILKASLVDPVREFLDKLGRYRYLETQIHRQQNDNRHKGDRYQKEKRSEKDARRVENVLEEVRPRSRSRLALRSFLIGGVRKGWVILSSTRRWHLQRPTRKYEGNRQDQEENGPNLLTFRRGACDALSPRHATTYYRFRGTKRTSVHSQTPNGGTRHGAPSLRLDKPVSRIIADRTALRIARISVNALHILPVLDLQKGIVVRGIAGRRHEYKPLATCWTSSFDPLAVAQALCDAFGFQSFYLADLDAIGGSAPAWKHFERLTREGFDLLVDAGVRTPAEGREMVKASLGCVLGLETIRGSGVVRELLQEFGSDPFAFSLDMKHGVGLADAASWGTTNPRSIADEVIGLGIRRLIVLDLARVGIGQGTGTEELCRELHLAYPGVRLIAGGGIRGVSDLEHLRHCGVSQALVASALHDGRLNPNDLVGFTSRPASGGIKTDSDA